MLKHRPLQALRGLTMVCLTVIVSYLLLLAALSLAPKPNVFHWQTWSTAYFDQSGELLRLTLADDDKYRLHSPLDQVTQDAIAAVLIYEDKDFYQHHGVSFSALFRAFWHTYILKSRQIGGSTISMQLARMAYDIESRTLFGKLQQILYALWIERHYEKQEILELYLNNLPYGGNIEGIAAASLIYFDKLPSQLNTAEALALTVIPQNPSKRYPVTDQGYQQMQQARLRLAEQWQQKSQWLDLPLHFRPISQLPFKAPHFVEYLHKNQTLDNQVITSLHLNTQQQLETLITEYLSAHQQQGFNNASALLLNHNTMEIEAWVGSADYFNAHIYGQVDGVTAKRSPGSTLKPFAYGLALDQGIIHPLSLLKDTPSRFAAYTPENYDMAYAGPINATEALITSRNVPAIRLAAQLKTPNLYQLLQKAEVTELKPRDHYGLSSVLGGVEVSMLELVRLYAMLANQGELRRLNPLRAVNSNGVSAMNSKSVNTIGSKEVGAIEANRLLSAESAWLTSFMLAQNPATDQTHQTRASYFVSQQPPIAWKTGTSFAFRDAWSIGYNQNYVLAVWLGNFNGEGNANLIGRKAAAPLFFKLFRSLTYATKGTAQATNDQRNTSALLSPEERPPNLRKVAICEATGDLPGKYCPNTVEGWFIPGVSPIKTSNVFRPVLINSVTGKRACNDQKDNTEQRVYQFWPSDLARLYAMAGIQHRQPPAFDDDCLTPVITGMGSPPQILSPSSQLTYYLSHAGEEIPLEAIVDSEVKRAYWFANGSFIGEVSAGERLFWQPKPGVYQLTVSDDQGLSDSTHITVDQALSQ